MSEILHNYVKRSYKEDLGLTKPINQTNSIEEIYKHHKKQTNVVNKIDNKFINTDDTIKTKVKLRGTDISVSATKFKKTANAFLDKSTVFFGPSGTGKTVLTKDFMYILRNYFPRVHVFAPTNSQNHSFDGYIPNPLIYEQITMKKLKEIYNYQMAAVNIYDNANNEQILCSLFKKISSLKSNNFLKKIDNNKKYELRKANTMKSITDKNDKIKQIEKYFSDKKIQVLKSVITKNKQRLESYSLSENEAFALKFLNLNPRCLIIFDDASKELQEIIKLGNSPKGKKEFGPIIDNFFYKGRHAKITHMYTFHGPTMTPPDIRRNIFHAVFTDKATAKAFFTNSTNQFTLEEKKKTEALVEEIFSEKYSKLHTKLIYSRMYKKKLQYIRAEEHEPFEMCSKIIRAYCDYINKKGCNFNTSNPQMTVFTNFLETDKK